MNHKNDLAKKILVVDDIHYVAKYLATILRDAGYNVLTSMSGGEALNRFEMFNPDLVTIDQKLPDMTGFELVNQLRKQNNDKRPKIVFISAVNEKETIESVLNLGIDSYLIKPVNMTKLLETVQSLLGH
jgi:DNA-binding response OmpR family regulator